MARATVFQTVDKGSTPLFRFQIKKGSMTTFLSPLKTAMAKVTKPPFGTNTYNAFMALRNYCYGIDPQIDALKTRDASTVARIKGIEDRLAKLEAAPTPAPTPVPAPVSPPPLP